MAPWHEADEEWRRLKITFPEHIATHCREQASYFGPDYLLRRHDHTVDILGGSTGANDALNYREFDGIKFPTTRRIYAYGPDGLEVADPLLVSIDMASVTL